MKCQYGALRTVCTNLPVFTKKKRSFLIQILWNEDSKRQKHIMKDYVSCAITGTSLTPWQRMLTSVTLATWVALRWL